MIKQVNKKNSGYTIIETMITTSIFIIIIMIGMGSLLNANSIYNKSQNMRSIMDNLSFIMEDMSRNIRTGYDYRCLVNDPFDLQSANVGTPKNGSLCWGIAFESATGDSTTADGDPIDNNDQWVYYIGPDTSLPGNPLAVWKSTEGPYTTSTNFFKLTPDEVVIDQNNGFSVSGASLGASDNQQPFVTIRLVGRITYKGVVTPFSLQTSVSQRAIDI